LVLQKESQPWEFSLAFLISAIGGAVSLFYLNRVPDVEAQESLRKSGTRVPWATIVTYPPFARLLGFNLLFTFTVGSLGVFSISFLKGQADLGENNILFLIAASSIAAVASLGMMGRLLDAVGSRRLLRWALALYMVFMVGWVGLSSRLIGPSPLLWLLLFALWGVAGSAINLANLRLIMSVMPEMGRSHFFAVYTVITNLCLGFSPILWGVCLDAMNGLKMAVGPHGAFEWNRYSIYFTALLALTGATFFAAAALVEKQPRPSEVK